MSKREERISAKNFLRVSSYHSLKPLKIINQRFNQFSVCSLSQIRGTVVLGAMWNDKTAVVSRIAIVSSVRTEIQS